MTEENTELELIIKLVRGGASEPSNPEDEPQEGGIESCAAWEQRDGRLVNAPHYEGHIVNQHNETEHCRYSWKLVGDNRQYEEVILERECSGEHIKVYVNPETRNVEYVSKESAGRSVTLAPAGNLVGLEEMPGPETGVVNGISAADTLELYIEGIDTFNRAVTGLKIAEKLGLEPEKVLAKPVETVSGENYEANPGGE